MASCEHDKLSIDFVERATVVEAALPHLVDGSFRSLSIRTARIGFY
jgi:hypothetical protein